MYIAWVNSHLPAEDFEPPVSGFNAQTFGGEMCYSLRCKVLHNGITDVNNQGLGVSVDSFKLTFPGNDDYYHGYRYIENNSGLCHNEFRREPDRTNQTLHSRVQMLLPRPTKEELP